jgi:hypothetical protein
MRTHLPLTVAGTAKSKKNTFRFCSREALAGIGVVNVATLADRISNNVPLRHNVKDHHRAVVVRLDFPPLFAPQGQEQVEHSCRARVDFAKKA